MLHQTALMYFAGVMSWVLSAPPSFVRLAGHPVRWRLMGELARSDRRVRELVRLLDQPQNLVSYHLGRLRTAGLVGARRSTFDARDAYYHLDLPNCAEALAGAGLALHPGLRLAPVSAAPPGRRCRVLFLCTGNSARSPVAEALLRQQAPQVKVTSAGSRPKPLHENTVRVLREYGIDLAGRPPQHLSVLAASASTTSSRCATGCERRARSSPARPSRRTGAFLTRPPRAGPARTAIRLSSGWPPSCRPASGSCSQRSARRPRTQLFRRRDEQPRADGQCPVPGR